MADSGLGRRRAEEVPVSRSANVRSTPARSETRRVKKFLGQKVLFSEAVTGQSLQKVGEVQRAPFGRSDVPRSYGYISLLQIHSTWALPDRAGHHSPTPPLEITGNEAESTSHQSQSTDFHESSEVRHDHSLRSQAE